jgi:hypothetical protein
MAASLKTVREKMDVKETPNNKGLICTIRVDQGHADGHRQRPLTAHPLFVYQTSSTGSAAT